jgi:hypothetical protein
MTGFSMKKIKKKSTKKTSRNYCGYSKFAGYKINIKSQALSYILAMKK